MCKYVMYSYFCCFDKVFILDIIHLLLLIFTPVVFQFSLSTILHIVPRMTFGTWMNEICNVAKMTFWNAFWV